MATVKRTYIYTSKDTLNTIGLVNGQVIALRDADELYYDISTSGSAGEVNLIRRQVSGVKVVDGLPDSDQREGIIYVDISGDYGTLPDNTPVFKLFVWESTTSTWKCVSSNYGDEQVKSESSRDTFWLVGSNTDLEKLTTLCQL